MTVRRMTNHTKWIESTEAAPEPEPYEPPEIIDLGGLRELTLSGHHWMSDSLGGAAGGGGGS